MREKYIDKRFTRSSREQIDRLNAIIDEYRVDNFVLTVRQLYYQLVARGHIPNTERSYKNTCELLNNARLAGLVDWNMIEDRTREFTRLPCWLGPNHFLRSVAPQYHHDLWKGQKVRPYVVVEKEALAGVFLSVCRSWDVPLLAARGYPSVSVLRDFVKSDLDTMYEGQEAMIFHFGDHDPSGIDMTRDLVDRIETLRGSVQLKRVALNLPQIKKYNPPPNPAKTTDSRFEDYARQFGDESWELDALEPRVLTDLARKHIQETVSNKSAMEKRIKRREEIRKEILELAEQYENEDE